MISGSEFTELLTRSKDSRNLQNSGGVSESEFKNFQNYRIWELLGFPLEIFGRIADPIFTKGMSNFAELKPAFWSTGISQMTLLGKFYTFFAQAGGFTERARCFASLNMTGGFCF